MSSIKTLKKCKKSTKLEYKEAIKEEIIKFLIDGSWKTHFVIRDYINKTFKLRLSCRMLGRLMVGMPLQRERKWKKFDGKSTYIASYRRQNG